MTRGDVTHLHMLAAATDETKGNVFAISEIERCRHERVEWMARPVIAGVHHNELDLRVRVGRETLPCLLRNT